MNPLQLLDPKGFAKQQKANGISNPNPGNSTTPAPIPAVDGSMALDSTPFDPLAWRDGDVMENNAPPPPPSTPTSTFANTQNHTPDPAHAPTHERAHFPNLPSFINLHPDERQLDDDHSDDEEMFAKPSRDVGASPNAKSGSSNANRKNQKENQPQAKPGLTIDPRVLLNPKAALSPAGKLAASKKRAHDEGERDDTVSVAGSSRTVSGDGSAERDTNGKGDTVMKNTGMGSMIENLNNVKQRDVQPVKRVKQPQTEEGDEDEDEDPHKKKQHATFRGGKGTVIGEYVRQRRKEGQAEAGPMPASNEVVDLTLEEDDDVILVNDTGDREVCMGVIKTAQVMAYQIPSPSQNLGRMFKEQWPPIKVQLKRRPGHHNQQVDVVDPAGNTFGRLDIRTANALVPLIDGVHLNRLRLRVTILPRPKKSGELPRQAISDSFKMHVTLYAPRKMVVGLGRHLSQRNVWLDTPSFVERNTEYFNPHDPKDLGPAAKIAAKAQNPGLSTTPQNYINRTAEDIRSDVQDMFNTLANTDDLPEADAPPQILTDLLPHQKQALAFMTAREQEREFKDGEQDPSSLWKLRYDKRGQKRYYNVITSADYNEPPAPVMGGILADEMGLGKTLSILSLIASTVDTAQEWYEEDPPDHNPSGCELLTNSKATLLVCPLSTVANWEEQIKTHIRDQQLSYYIYHGSKRSKDTDELAQFDIVITTYSIIAAEYDRQRGVGPIEQINWFRIVLDEGHLIREQSTKQSQAICALQAQRRWAVTGTPVQNRLDDLGALIKFLRVKPFDERGGFQQYILAPFKNADPDILPKLRLLVDSLTLRRLKNKLDLPERKDQIVRLDFTKEEFQLHEVFAKDSQNKVSAITNNPLRKTLGGKAYAHVLRAILRLRLICAHGSELLSEEDMKAIEGMSYSNAIDLGDDDDDDKPVLQPKQAYEMLNLLQQSDADACEVCKRRILSSRGDLLNATTTTDTEAALARDEEALDSLDPGVAGTSTTLTALNNNTLGYMLPCYQVICNTCFAHFAAELHSRATPDNYVTCPLCEQYMRLSFFELTVTGWREDDAARQALRANPRLAKQILRYNGPHTKTRALLADLKESATWSAAHPDEPPIKSIVFSGWTAHLDLIQMALDDNKILTCRLDGRMSRSQRAAALNQLNTDAKICVMLVSIGAGGLGLNLTAANKVYVMEPQYNPAAEAQAVDRVHRLGQTRAVVITRFIMARSFEEKMLILQGKKQQLADLSLNRNQKLDRAEAAKQRLEELRSLFR